jgi:hypothetical protein
VAVCVEETVTSEVRALEEMGGGRKYKYIHLPLGFWKKLKLEKRHTVERIAVAMQWQQGGWIHQIRFSATVR